MKKFAMVPICFKEDENRNLIVRRVLISYRFKTHKRSKIKSLKGLRWTYYHGTKFVSYDDYFTKSEASHKYSFFDKEYLLEEVTNEREVLYMLNPDIYAFRKYHALTKPYKNIFGEYPHTIEFKAKTEEEAIKIFNEREELR